jgi:hypothetical protein
VQNSLSRQNTLSVIAKVSVGIDVAIEGHGFDAELGREGGNRGVSIRHGGLREPDLSLCQGELPPAFPTTRPGGGKASHGALPDQIPLELNQRREDTEDQGGTTTLMVFAAVSENTDALQALMDIGADINATNELGFTALMFAAAYNRPEIGTFLLSSGADISARAYDRDLNALHVASLLHPDPAMVGLLVEAGLPLEEPITTGETPLVLAVMNNPNLEVAERMVELGADTSVSGEGGQLVGALAQSRVTQGAPVFRRIDDDTTARIISLLAR